MRFISHHISTSISLSLVMVLSSACDPDGELLDESGDELLDESGEELLDESGEEEPSDESGEEPLDESGEELSVDDDDDDDESHATVFAGPFMAALNPGKCIQKAAGTNNGTKIYLKDCGWPWQYLGDKVWLYDIATGMIRLAADPTKCLHANADLGHTALWPCGNPWDSNWANKRWVLSNGLIKLFSNGKCLQKANGNWDNGNPIVVSDCGYFWENVPDKTWILK